MADLKRRCRHLTFRTKRSIVFSYSSAIKAKSSRPGGRRGVYVSDLQTGNAEAGKRYFSGAGGCAKCHSATGDLAGVANRFQGLQLEQQMLYPRNAKNKVTVTLPDGRWLLGSLLIAMSSRSDCVTRMGSITHGRSAAFDTRWIHPSRLMWNCSASTRMTTFTI